MITLNRVGMHNNLRNNEYYCLAKDIPNLPNDIMNGAIAYIIDYKTAKTSKELVFDKENKQWVKRVEHNGSAEAMTDYSQLNNKPKINDVDLVGDKTSKQLGLASLDDIQMLENEKANYTYKVIANDKVSQIDAREVLEFIDQYEGKIIEFLTNGDNPSKAVATGRIFTDKNGNSYLITYNLDGTITQWNKDTFEKHSIESYNYTTQTIDIDNLTIDIQGQAPFVTTVNKAFNKPPQTSDFGCVTVFAYNTEKQIQIYRDMENGKIYQRLITGRPDNHSFGSWINGLMINVLEIDPVNYTNGMVWYNTTENRYKCVENGVIKKIVTE